MKLIKIYGERNTGTHYLAKLVADNCEATVLPGTVPELLSSAPELLKDLFFAATFERNLGWKHCYVDDAMIQRTRCWEHVGCVALVKNPYSFALSLYKNPYHFRGEKPRSFEEFLQCDWALRRRDNMGTRSVNGPVDLWNQKTASYVRCRSRLPAQFIVIRYEDLLAAPAEGIEKIAAKFGLNGHGNFTNMDKSAKGDRHTFSDYREYYLNERWREKLSDDAVRIMKRKLDAGLAAEFGYQVLEA